MMKAFVFLLHAWHNHNQKFFFLSREKFISKLLVDSQMLRKSLSKFNST